MSKIDDSPETTIVPDIKIPTELLQFVLTAKQSHHFAFFVLLKFIYRNGQFIDLDRKLCADTLKVSLKTIDNHFKAVQALKWVNHDKVSGKCYIRGFSTLCNRYNLNPNRAVRFSLNHITHLKAFCFASVISTLFKKRKWVNQNLNKIDQHGRSMLTLIKTSEQQSIFHHYYEDHQNSPYMVPVRFLSRLLKMGLNTICHLKKLIERFGFAEITHNKTFIESGHTFESAHRIQTANPEIANCLRVKNADLYLIQSDSFRVFGIAQTRRITRMV